jgi:hypothetical protein
MKDDLVRQTDKDGPFRCSVVTLKRKENLKIVNKTNYEMLSIFIQERSSLFTDIWK